MDRKKIITQAFKDFTGDQDDVLESFYAKKIVFCDPVKKISGLPALKKYYRHVYSNVDSIQFKFSRFIESENTVVGEWVMTLKVKSLNWSKPFEVSGCSVFEFDEKNQVTFHRDYLDLGEMVYEKIPVLGLLVKAIKAKL
jgi:hypothetical protein